MKWKFSLLAAMTLVVVVHFTGLVLAQQSGVHDRFKRMSEQA